MGSASVPSIGQLWEGRTIDGKFALLEWLGGATDRAVFITMRLGAQRAVIKIIQADGVDADAWQSQWEIARSLSHPHLMPIFETGRCSVDGVSIVYIVTEYAERVLSRFIQDRPLKPNEASNILYPIVDALSYLHAKGFVHGRVCPSNILVAADELKLSTDNFLVAGAVPTRLHKSDVYDAPELAAGNLSPAADVWSLGMTLAEALAQIPPVWDPAASSPPAVPQVLPHSFLVLAQECLRIDPAERTTLQNIKAQLAAAPTPSEDTPAASIPAQFPAQFPAHTPAPTRAASKAPAAHAPAPGPDIDPLLSAYANTPGTADSAPAGRWKQDEFASSAPPSHALFEDYDEASRTRKPILSLVLVGLVLLGVLGFFLVQTGIVDMDIPLSLLKGRQPAAHQASQPAPSQAAPNQAAPTAQPPATATSPEPTAPQSSEAPTPDTETPAPATQPGAQTTPAPTDTAPTATGKTPTPTSGKQQTATQPAQAPTDATPPSSSAKQANNQTAGQTAGQAAAPADTPHDTDTAAPRPRNAPGAVAQRVLPSISPGASLSMRAPVTVILHVTVYRSGSVADASYVSPGSGNYFARIAQRAALQWKFDPPLQAGRPQPSVWTLRFYFSRRDVDVTAEEEDR